MAVATAVQGMPSKLKETVRRAIEAGHMRGAHMARWRLWKDRAHSNMEALGHLALDAAEQQRIPNNKATNNLLKDQQYSADSEVSLYTDMNGRRGPQIQEHPHEAWKKQHGPAQQHMRVKSTRTSQQTNGGQMTATTTVFLPDAMPSDEEVEHMDSSSEDDAFAATAMIDLWESMKTDKQQQTHDHLQRMADDTNNIPANPIIAVLGHARRNPRKPTALEGKSKQEVRQAKLLDGIFHKEIIRKGRKWCKAMRKALVSQTKQKQPQDGNVQSPGKSSMASQISLRDAESFIPKGNPMHTVDSKLPVGSQQIQDNAAAIKDATLPHNPTQSLLTKNSMSTKRPATTHSTTGDHIDNTLTFSETQTQLEQHTSPLQSRARPLQNQTQLTGPPTKQQQSPLESTHNEGSPARTEIDNNQIMG